MQTASSLVQRAHSLKSYQGLHRENNWQEMQMCWLLPTKVRKRNVMCLEWQVEVSHIDTAGPNDISAWQSYTTRGGRWNVSMQTNVWMAFCVGCHVLVWVMWFSIYSCSPDANFMILISARPHLVHVYPHSPKSTPAPLYLEICHVSPQCTCSPASVYVSSWSRRHAVLNNKAKDVPFGWWDSSLPMSDLPSALMAALGAIMIMMEISQAITGRQRRAHCRHTNGLICNWERGKWLSELAVALSDRVCGGAHTRYDKWNWLVACVK